MHEPMVIVTCDVIEHNLLSWSSAPAAYGVALAEVGLLPVQLPTLVVPLDPSSLLDVASGVLITGARSNVHPSHYGAEPSPEAEPHDAARDAASLPLIRAALDRGIPLLAICRGIQELNVACGGTLSPEVHTLPDRLDHRSEPQADLAAWFALKHPVSVEDGGLLAPIMGAGERQVNSVHRQAIDRVGDGVFVEARAPDGTVEAISVPGSDFALGVQWHPEQLVMVDAHSRAIFAAFAEAVRAHANAGRRARAA